MYRITSVLLFISFFFSHQALGDDIIFSGEYQDISFDRFHNVRGMQMGYESLNMKSIKEIPLVLGEKDLLKVAQMLPGIQTVGEGSSGFNVRGSPADQNMFYINKIPVYNTSHLFDSSPKGTTLPRSRS